MTGGTVGAVAKVEEPEGRGIPQVAKEVGEPHSALGETAEAAFAAQRFHRFQIDSPADDGETALRFSLDSDVLVAGTTGN